MREASADGRRVGCGTRLRGRRGDHGGWLRRLLVSAAVAALVPQGAPGEVMKTGRVERATSPITIDGVLDEPAWAEALEIPLLYEWSPGDNVAPPVASEAFITYDDEALYVAFRNHDPEPEAIRAHLMDRDLVATFVQDDHVVLIIDTFNDERRGFQFRVNPLGVQMDAVFSEVDGIEDFSFDMIWDSAGSIDDGGWNVELRIPLNQLRFPRSGEAQTWGFDVGRSYPRSLRHRIAGHPRERGASCVLCQVVKVTGFEGVEPGRNLELSPTLTVTQTDTIDTFPGGSLQSGDPDTEPGLTMRWGITPNVSLVGTVNPDFSQVEADVAQLAVNERFALFFPEKRPFFLEGIDFFSTPIDAVFTRTVVNPEWGLKATGKEGRNGFGVFVARDEVTSLLFPSNGGSAQALLDERSDTAVVRYRRDVGDNSTLGALLTSRDGNGYHNRVAGLDGFFRFSDQDTVSFQYLSSDTDYPGGVADAFGQPDGEFSGAAWEIGYDHFGRNWLWFVDLESYDRDFRADSGFVSRVDVREARSVVIRRWYPQEGTDTWWSRSEAGLFLQRTEDDDGRLTDESFDLWVNYSGPRQSFGEISVDRNETFFQGILYDELDSVQLYYEIQPTGKAKFQMFVNAGDTIDFANNRRAEQLRLSPSVEAKIGRHWNLKIDHTTQELDVEGGRLFRADLSQLRAIYNINVRSFVRAILQHRQIDRDPGLFDFDVEPQTESLFSQLLFSYKLNAQTVLFAGYTNNRLGLQGIDLTETDRTFFVKLGYAWIL